MRWENIIADAKHLSDDEESVLQLIEMGHTFPLRGIHVSPYWVKKAARDLENDDTLIYTTIGSEEGSSLTQVKLFELEQAIKQGAFDIGVHLNMSAFRSNIQWCKIEFLQLSNTAHEKEKCISLSVPSKIFDQKEADQISALIKQNGVDGITLSEDNINYLPTFEKLDIEIKLKTNNLTKFQHLLQQNETALMLPYVNLS
ncbi:hypothetical protein MY04_0249 [Flammeovirga sp. MY04]|uniref:hypothetical protein n=1 Tax=Flammeovirga sp. MY04 TaxID=1191459 RepID=UPI0008063471|nr:hypothetical protein [Flammeovirga sp. MY04]ANQ47631.1 hypothetical protein MY04_0249 [Flammeovirga sp. MY04]